MKTYSNLIDPLIINYLKNNKKEQFIPGKTLIPPSGKLIGFEEIKNMIVASLDGWLTSGKFNS